MYRLGLLLVQYFLVYSSMTRFRDTGVWPFEMFQTSSERSVVGRQHTDLWLVHTTGVEVDNLLTKKLSAQQARQLVSENNKFVCFILQRSIETLWKQEPRNGSQ